MSLLQKRDMYGDVSTVAGRFSDRPETYHTAEDIITRATTYANRYSNPQGWENRIVCRHELGYSIPPQTPDVIELIENAHARRAAYLRAQAKAAEYQRKKRDKDAKQHGKQKRPYMKRNRR